jgi:glutamyl-Q tRNA(Asp) synthetase
MMSTPGKTTRFAPSPTGFLHLGHAFAALAARAAGERFLLRIEDIDTTRARRAFEAAIFEDLAWLGLEWEKPVLRQSDRFADYRAALSRLEDRSLVYPCFCTRREIEAEIASASEAPHGPEGPLYPGTCRRLSRPEREARIRGGMPFALRLDSARAAKAAGPLAFDELESGPLGEHGSTTVDPNHSGDIVLTRKETPASYQLAVVVDDAFQGVDLVTRGNDLFGATHVQRLLQALLNLPTPRYAHHRLVLDERGQKLSKRHHSETLRSLRAGGVTPAQIRERLGF